MPLCAEQLQYLDKMHRICREAVLADALESGPIEVMIERVSYCALEDRMSCYRRPSVRRRVSLKIETMSSHKVQDLNDQVC